MAVNGQLDFESLIFDYIDELKFLLFPDRWLGVFLDYSKNELLTLLLLFRRRRVNMTEIADYIHAPLNTATGVVGRLEKQKMVERKRDSDDRRVVNIVITDKADEFINEQKRVIEYYFNQVYNALTEDERASLIGIGGKIISVLKSGNGIHDQGDAPVKRIKRITIE